MALMDMDMTVITDDMKHNAALVGDILLTGVQGQSREDYRFALNCTYLAQRQADNTYNSAIRPGRWIDYYADVLWSHGWNRDHPPIEHVQTQFYGSVRQVWSKLASPILSRDQVEGVNLGLAALEKDVELLKKVKGVSGKAFDFKIMPISYNANGDMELVVSNIRFIKSSMNTEYLFWDISQVMNQLDVLARKVVISRREMDAVRQSVEDATRALALKFSEYEL
ncbi:hypothetical protein B7L09_14205 [Pseudomonas mandelii]|uniref:hypothetical protein n=1 Tax=Pseudomonas mandelii TaxID=75612 RepID=UPI000B960C52|nr:hypothetical protein [Pseudomonas mandelii]OYQ19078.1 hypothetical protein B7L09_14205 [Pseudomonas mandelii]